MHQPGTADGMSALTHFFLRVLGDAYKHCQSPGGNVIPGPVLCRYISNTSNHLLPTPHTHTNESLTLIGHSHFVLDLAVLTENYVFETPLASVGTI